MTDVAEAAGAPATSSESVGLSPASSGLRPDSARAAGATTAPERLSGVNFPVVGIGASAGGLEAFTQLLAQLPTDGGMALVLVQHFEPTHRSFLGEALVHATEMPVSEARHGQRVEPNHVYVIPPGADISIEKGRLLLAPRGDELAEAHPPQLPHLPIDLFFRSLAAERGSQAIGVVLSGTASDGTEGLRAIKAEGGLTFAQDPETAKFAAMPRSAIEAGVVDRGLPIVELAKELVRLTRHPYIHIVAGAGRPPGGDAATLAKIMAVVKSATGVDFKEYKAPTFERRLARRMALRRVADLEIYLGLLRRDPEEARALYEDTLIHVSSFFRDPQVWETLKTSVFPAIVKDKPEGAPIRFWVAGCSTGEEVYSLAIALLEFLGAERRSHPAQIFGSDVSERAIQAARAGRYTEGAMRGISDERRQRHFTAVDRGCRVNKAVRDLCVFGRHNLAHDPPFSKLDLLSCRNVLIYFDMTLQKRVLPMFHHSLNQPGFLLLGRTEHISGFGRLFSEADRASKIFARTDAPSSLHRAPASAASVTEAPAAAGGAMPPARGALDIVKHLDGLLLARYAPPGVVIDEAMEILQFHGDTGAYLQPAPGEARNNLVKIARAELLSTLRVALAHAKREMAPVKTSGVPIVHDGSTRICDVVVVPFSGLPRVKELLFVVLFEEVAPAKSRSRRARRKGAAKTGDAPRAPTPEHELSATSEYLRALIGERSRANEELQSTNEELTAVNDELQTRNLELRQVNGDLVNLLTTVDLPIVILDRQRRIRRFTPHARDLFNLRPSDEGRLLDDILLNVDVPDLDQQIAEVIETVAARESEVRDRDGRWYRMQIRPYKITDDRADGAIVSLFDIDALKHTVRDAQKGRADAEQADRAKDQFLAVLSHELRTPLSVTMMQAQLLRRIGTDRAKLDRVCTSIERSTRMQTQLVDDLLDVSRIITGKLRINLQPVDLTAVVKATVDGVTTMIEDKSIEMRVSMRLARAPVLGDRVRLEQVVSNLLTNAIKFVYKGGAVMVTLDRVDGQACLEISDTGIGIDPSFLPHVFNRFSQADISQTQPHGGLGLGLAIVRHLVEAHAGTVRAESPGVGRGSSFYVKLPLMAGGAELAES
jgi:two-component system CheB/CheR fusion protein